MTAPHPALPRGGSRGLTLIELMVALGILALLMSLAVPSFGSIMARQRLKAAADGVAMDLAEMRFEATRRGLPLHVSFVPGAQWCYALAVAPGCDCRMAQACQLKTVHAGAHPGVSMPEARDAAFDPLPGRASNGGQAVLQGADGARLRIALSPLGRPAVCAPDVAVAGYPRC